MSSHPFRFVKEDHLPAVFGWASLLSLLTFLGLRFSGDELLSLAAPMGIVSFELAGDPETAAEILGSWGEEGRIFAGLNLGLDFLFLFAYPTAIGTGCIILARKMAGTPYLQRLGIWLSWGMLGAASLDLMENLALVGLLTGWQASWLPALARWCAIPKFILVLLALAYFLLGGLHSISAWFNGNRSPGGSVQ